MDTCCQTNGQLKNYEVILDSSMGRTVDKSSMEIILFCLMSGVGVELKMDREIDSDELIAIKKTYLGAITAYVAEKHPEHKVRLDDDGIIRGTFARIY